MTEALNIKSWLDQTRVKLKSHWELLALAARSHPDEVMPWESASRELDDLEAIDHPTEIDEARRAFLRALRAKGAIE